MNIKAPGRKKGVISLHGARNARRRRVVAEALPSPQLPPDEFTRGCEDFVVKQAIHILGERLRKTGACLSSPDEVRQFLRLHLAAREREAFAVLFLNAQNRVIAFEVLFEGTLTQTNVYPREVVRRAMQHNAAAVILAHNHPSGSVKPSADDESLTAVLKAALSLVGVATLDHIVVGDAGAASFAELGLL